MNSPDSFLTTHHGIVLAGILIACVVMMFFLIKTAIQIKVMTDKSASCAEELQTMNETICLIQSRIGRSHRKLSMLTTASHESEHSRTDDMDFRERLSKV